MPKQTLPLSDAQIKRCKPQDKPYRLCDGGGLCLYTSIAGSKSWQYRYKINGKRTTMTLGSYPGVGLAKARTFLHERLGFSPDAIEAQLGHRVPDRLGRACNRTKHLDERIRMMQAWADYLDGLK